MKGLIVTIMLSANVHAGCLDHANIFIENTKRTMQKISTQDMEHIIQDWMDSQNKEQGYLKGLTPEWNITNVHDLRADLSNNLNRKYQNIIGNLDHERHVIELQEMGINMDDEAVAIFLEDIQIMLVLKEWRKRLSE